MSEPEKKQEFVQISIIQGKYLYATISMDAEDNNQISNNLPPNKVVKDEILDKMTSWFDNPTIHRVLFANPKAGIILVMFEVECTEQYPNGLTKVKTDQLASKFFMYDLNKWTIEFIRAPFSSTPHPVNFYVGKYRQNNLFGVVKKNGKMVDLENEDFDKMESKKKSTAKKMKSEQRDVDDSQNSLKEVEAVAEQQEDKKTPKKKDSLKDEDEDHKTHEELREIIRYLKETNDELVKKTNQTEKDSYQEKRALEEMIALRSNENEALIKESRNLANVNQTLTNTLQQLTQRNQELNMRNIVLAENYQDLQITENVLRNKQRLYKTSLREMAQLLKEQSAILGYPVTYLDGWTQNEN